MSSLLNIILTCFECILDCPWSFLASDEKARSTDKGGCIIAVSIANTYTKDTCIDSTCDAGAWIKCIGIGVACIKDICAKNAFVEGVRPWV